MIRYDPAETINATSYLHDCSDWAEKVDTIFSHMSIGPALVYESENSFVETQKYIKVEADRRNLLEK